MGRQPTSGYCETCRRRRVKCDKKRPECGRCLSSGHRCGGYHVPLRMQSLGIQSGDDGTQRLKRISTFATRRGLSALVQCPISIPPELDMGAFQSEIATSYFFESYGWAPFWQHTMLTAATDDAPHLNKDCLSAIVYGYAGMKQGDAALCTRAGRLYGRVLQRVRSMIGASDKSELALLTVTIMLLDMYEFTTKKSVTDHLSHHLGLESILQHCGPEFFQQPGFLQIFRSCRALLLCHNVYRRTRSFLQDEPWKTIPWKYEPKSFEDRLTDLFLDLTGIVQDLATVRTSGGNVDDFLARLATVSASLRTWRRDWDRAHEGSVRRVWRAAGVPPGLEFDSPRLALDVLYYDAALIYLMQIEAAVQHTQPTRGVSSGKSWPTRVVSSGKSWQDQEQGQSNKTVAEALVAMACIVRSLPRTRGRETVVTPAPIGIIYSTLRNQSQMHALVQLVEGEFEDAQEIFSVYQASPLDVVLGGTSRLAPEGG
ncbi:hypothetical protein QBC34DRAFT_363910 [Podospora aff. communis PSN243]|uniref:Zn(2)-C6 fungal-type domain-containing protein n=1 Tax=Podospora aff. communis PSN243 TaxID=3040156 RepID=A0AAV9G2G0_9PEZI|nr:hypothetical protein QBC34DRAFT_363910 [Podospora aff. communis PSN243]